MKSIKKFIIFFLSGILCFSMFFGCDGGGTEEDRRMRYLEGLLNPREPVEINIMHYYTADIYTSLKNLVVEFNTTIGAQKGIFVTETQKSNMTVLYNSIVNSINNAVGAEPLPNIIHAYNDTIYPVEQTAGIVDMTDYFRASEIDAFLDRYIDEGRSGADNALKILPFAKSTDVLVVNKKAWDAFAAADGTVSLDDLATMEGLKDVSEKFYEKYEGKAFFGRDTFSNYMIVGLKQLGYDMFTEDANGKFKVCEEKAAYKTLWENMYVPSIKGSYISSSAFRSDEMQNEKIIAYIGSSASAVYIPQVITSVQGVPVTEETEYDNDPIILPLPYFENGEKVNVQQGAGMSIIKSDEKSEYASAVFLKWLTENERNIKFALDTGYSPVKKSAGSFEEIKASEFFDAPTIKPYVKASLEAIYSMQEDEYSFYFTKGFENATDIRDNLLSTRNFAETAPYKESMQYKMYADPKRLEAGEVTLDYLLSDEYFETWYSELIAAIKIMIG